MLSNKSITKEYATGEKITNGEAWSLIPYAWSHVKVLTAQNDKLEQESIYVEERPPLYPPVTDTDASQVNRRYVRLIASVMDGCKIQFSLDKNQRDAQDMAEEIRQKVRNKVAKRYGMRDRSSSIERDTVESFKSKHGEEPVATMLVEMLEGEDASDRKAARHVIRKSKHK
ncbi:hypothetical protein BGX24_004792 [Mortierella sp. AD032]|nr:hypothetical protein BGX24_004792 [Mortierella sp. AD032]